MRCVISASLALSFFTPFVLGGIWPLPRSLTNGTSFLQLAPDFKFNVGIEGASDDLYIAINRTTRGIKNDLIERLTIGRGAQDQQAISAASTLSSVSLVLEDGAAVLPIAEEAVKSLGNRIEGYSLHIPEDGSEAIISANSTLGLLHGLTSFEQVWYKLDNVTYTNLAPVTIENDAPAYVCFFVA